MEHVKRSRPASAQRIPQNTAQHSGGQPSSAGRSALQFNLSSVPLSRAEASPPDRPNRTGLPDRLKFGAEMMSGYALDHVRVHYNSSLPARYGALAHAQGTQIHLGPGQAKHLPHETWHVVQQAQGRVSATGRMNGASINDNPALEREADVMGSRIAGYSGRTPGDLVAAPGKVNQGPIQGAWLWFWDPLSRQYVHKQLAKYPAIADAYVDNSTNKVYRSGEYWEDKPASPPGGSAPVYRNPLASYDFSVKTSQPFTGGQLLDSSFQGRAPFHPSNILLSATQGGDGGLHTYAQMLPTAFGNNADEHADRAGELLAMQEEHYVETDDTPFKMEEERHAASELTMLSQTSEQMRSGMNPALFRAGLRMVQAGTITPQQLPQYVAYMLPNGGADSSRNQAAMIRNSDAMEEARQNPQRAGFAQRTLDLAEELSQAPEDYDSDGESYYPLKAKKNDQLRGKYPSGQ